MTKISALILIFIFGVSVNAQTDFKQESKETLDAKETMAMFKEALTQGLANAGETTIVVARLFKCQQLPTTQDEIKNFLIYATAFIKAGFYNTKENLPAFSTAYCKLRKLPPDEAAQKFWQTINALIKSGFYNLATLSQVAAEITEPN